MEELKLGSLCDITSSKRIFASDYVSSGIPFYRSKEIIEKSKNINISETLFITVEKYSEIKNKFGVPQEGDLLLTSVGTLGIPYVVKKDDCFYFKDGNLTWMKNFSDKLSSKYLYYWLISDFGKNSLLSRAIGSSQGAITIDILKKYKIICPKLSIQNKVVKILSTYDNLIENNNKRIKLLEQMAENLYKEWFVRFRFPGYENAEFENGIPKGWNYKLLRDILNFDRGISYSTKEIDCDDGLNLVNLKNIEGYGGYRRDGLKHYNGKYKEAQVVVKGDLIMGVTDMTQDRRTVGAVALIPNLQGINVISADLVKINTDISKVFLYSLCKFGFYSKYFSQFANGANVLHLKPNTLLNKKILLPTKNLIDSYDKIVSKYIDLIDELNQTNDNLIKQRDLLLPRLMSGKLEVE